jgi:hypothetical protein
MDPDHPFFKNSPVRLTPDGSKIWIPYQYPVPLTAKAAADTPREWRVEPTQLEHSVIDFKKVPRYQEKPGSVFWDFLSCVCLCAHNRDNRIDVCMYSFWRNGMTISRLYALSVGRNKYLRRQIAPARNTPRGEEASTIPDLTEKAAIHKGFDLTRSGYDPNIQPLAWRLQPLIVQDPFIPTYASASHVMLMFLD